MDKAFDPELLYVECSKCGRPVVWRAGDTTRVLEMAGIDAGEIDERCLMLSEGCPECMPEENAFTTQVVRLKSGDRTSGEHAGEHAGKA